MCMYTLEGYAYEYIVYMVYIYICVYMVYIYVYVYTVYIGRICVCVHCTLEGYVYVYTVCMCVCTFKGYVCVYTVYIHVYVCIGRIYTRLSISDLGAVTLLRT